MGPAQVIRRDDLQAKAPLPCGECERTLAHLERPGRGAGNSVGFGHVCQDLSEALVVAKALRERLRLAQAVVCLCCLTKRIERLPKRQEDVHRLLERVSALRQMRESHPGLLQVGG